MLVYLLNKLISSLHNFYDEFYLQVNIPDDEGKKEKIL